MRQRLLDEFPSGSPDSGPAPMAEAAPPGPLPGVWQVRDGYIVHPLLAEETIRALPFQIDLARIGLDENLLVVLPTGLGKTVIAALVAAEFVRRRTGKVLFLAPTRPLVLQHHDSFGRWFRHLRRARFTGTVQRPVRAGSWDPAEVIFATPEIVVNDLQDKRYDLARVALIVFDEAHHAVGKYAYVPIAERYRTDREISGRVLGLTASPGGKDARVEEVVGHLGVTRIEARTRDEEGVREFVQPVEVAYRWVALGPEARRIQEQLRTASHDEARRLQKMGYLRKKPIANVSVKDLVDLRSEIFARPGPMVRKFGPLFHQLILLHLHHALERLETQGIQPFVQYLDRLSAKEKPSRGDAAFLKRAEVIASRKEAVAFLHRAHSSSHPKLDALVSIIREEEVRPRDHPLRVLVFAQYRDTIQGIQGLLEKEGWAVRRFVGQASRVEGDRGMSQKEQAQVLEAYRNGTFPVLVASSVAEEGLDVPDVDLVVFFEAVPSEIRAIQRRGRTGRSSLGRVIVLLTEGTRDVGYQAAEGRRETAMRRIVRRLSAEARRRRQAAHAEGKESDRTTDDSKPPRNRTSPVPSTVELK